jgi:hypothetical protein
MLLAAFLVFMPGASAGVRVAHDPEVDFTRFGTYAWNERECLKAAVPDIQNAIVRSVERELEARGLRKVDLGNADLQVVTFAIGEALAGSMGGFYRHPSWDWGFITKDARMVTRGALVIDLRDPADGRPVWHAVAEKTITDPEKAVYVVDRVTKKAFADFPPRPSREE